MMIILHSTFHLLFRVLLVSPNLFLGGNKQYRVGVCLFTVFCDRMENNL